MKECIDEWLSRPFAPQTTPPRIMSRNDRPLLEDQAARRALRRLYHHVISHENPLITAGGAGWTEQLGVLVDDLCENLAKTAIVDSSTSPLWVPEELTQPLKGTYTVQCRHSRLLTLINADWKTVVVPKFSPPPEPWELPSEPEPEVHKKDFNKSVDLQSEWRCYKLSSEYTPESIAADIFNGVRNTSDPDATKMPLHTPPSYHSQQIPPLRLQQHTEEAARIQGPV
jgi:hypothetical protein